MPSSGRRKITPIPFVSYPGLGAPISHCLSQPEIILAFDHISKLDMSLQEQRYELGKKKWGKRREKKKPHYYDSTVITPGRWAVWVKPPPKKLKK